MGYFYDCKTLDEAKKKYRAFAKELHPDMPIGSNEKMAELTKQYEAFKNETEDKSHWENPFSSFYSRFTTETDESFRSNFKRGSDSTFGGRPYGSAYTDKTKADEFNSGNGTKEQYVERIKQLEQELESTKEKLRFYYDKYFKEYNENIDQEHKLESKERLIKKLKGQIKHLVEENKKSWIKKIMEWTKITEKDLGMEIDEEHS